MLSFKNILAYTCHPRILTRILTPNVICHFQTVRNQTRYRRQDYVGTPYKVSVVDNEKSLSWAWLINRSKQLGEINYETTLKDYHSQSQRKLMTEKLRRQIKERDHYTCQICGKYMPDEIGLQIDHIVPIIKGGKTVPSNLQVLCSKCNRDKFTKLVDENLHGSNI